jgi:thiosulfate/3-mercaptopyruvate sulfurtransferase
MNKSYTTLISATELDEILHHSDVVVFDCRFDLADATRGEQAFCIEHIPGAAYAHLDHHLSGPITCNTGRHPLPDINLFSQWLAANGVSDDSLVIAYDDTQGTMASRLWWLLNWLGHQRVAVLNGGIQAWQAAGYELTDVLSKNTAGNFSAKPSMNMVVTTQEMISNLTTHHLQIIDVRARERFDGIKEPLDPVAGHIPGALNVPLFQNINEHGFFRSSDELYSLYSEQLPVFNQDQRVLMCGSGVTAAHSVLAMKLAGLEMPRLYAGSWSEWIRYPDNPIASQIRQTTE